MVIFISILMWWQTLTCFHFNFFSQNINVVAPKWMFWFIFVFRRRSGGGEEKLWIREKAWRFLWGVAIVSHTRRWHGPEGRTETGSGRKEFCGSNGKRPFNIIERESWGFQSFVWPKTCDKKNSLILDLYQK